jgi:hypothetical protein
MHFLPCVFGIMEVRWQTKVEPLAGWAELEFKAASSLTVLHWALMNGAAWR